jgi:hypothetical protein
VFVFRVPPKKLGCRRDVSSCSLVIHRCSGAYQEGRHGLLLFGLDTLGVQFVGGVEGAVEVKAGTFLPLKLASLFCSLYQTE